MIELSDRHRLIFSRYVSWGTLKGWPEATRGTSVQLSLAKKELGLTGNGAIACLAWTLRNHPEWIDEESPLGKSLGRMLQFSRFGQRIYAGIWELEAMSASPASA